MCILQILLLSILQKAAISYNQHLNKKPSNAPAPGMVDQESLRVKNYHLLVENSRMLKELVSAIGKNNEVITNLECTIRNLREKRQELPMAST